MRAYVTTVGTSPEAVFNPLWYFAEIRSWVPDEVYLLWNEDVKEELEKVKGLIGRLSKAYRKEIKINAGEELRFDESDPVEFRKKAGRLVQELSKRGEVVVDITPGRKFMSALLLGAALVEKAGEVTYLHLDDWRRYVGKLLFEVPMAKQRLFGKKELTGEEGTIKFQERTKGSVEERKVTREHLMVFLDSLYLDGETRLPVKVAGETIGTMTLGERATFRVPDYIALDDELHGDYSIIRQAIIAGGMAKFENWEDLISLIRRYRGDRRPLYIGFDTNTLLYRVPSKLLADERLKEKGNLIFDLVYSDEVQREIAGLVNHKLPYGRELGNYSNQPTPRARLASLGRVELRRIQLLGAERVSSREALRGDQKIALDYKVFAEEKDANVIVLTADDRAYSQMDTLGGSGLIPLKLKPVFSFGKTLNGEWEELRDTLYALASVLGEVHVGRYRLNGIWAGKNTEDWNEERVILGGFEYGRIFDVLEQGKGS